MADSTELESAAVPPSRNTVLPGVSTRWISVSVRGSSEEGPVSSSGALLAAASGVPARRVRERVGASQHDCARCADAGEAGLRDRVRSVDAIRAGDPRDRLARGVDDDRRRDVRARVREVADGGERRAARGMATELRVPNGGESQSVRKIWALPGVVPGWIFMPDKRERAQHRRRCVLDRHLQPRARPAGPVSIVTH